MKKKPITIVDDIALSNLRVDSTSEEQNLTPRDWILLLRTYLRMTQAELSKRANITQANLVAIESGKVDPRVSTLQRIYKGLSCHLSVAPRPQKPLEEILRGRARAVALKRLKKTMGTMALEEQAPDKDIFKKLLEKRTDEILRDPRERLWRKDDD
ncbi:MAG: helix-turn-helix domain-containing protein [Nitrospirae bacterium]|nr:helix-turn-helix domain-containing protein [Nitrospirota bacterium]MDA1303854.1 helix-turn-helix domain-containing protein [Nitrospirota bacterium]